jgi:hypothetical protein
MSETAYTPRCGPLSPRRASTAASRSLRLSCAAQAARVMRSDPMPRTHVAGNVEPQHAGDAKGRHVVGAGFLQLLQAVTRARTAPISRISRVTHAREVGGASGVSGHAPHGRDMGSGR